MKDDDLLKVEKMHILGIEFAPIEYSGAYRLGVKPDYFQINLKKKPILIHRFFMRICFGFKWIDQLK